MPIITNINTCLNYSKGKYNFNNKDLEIVIYFTDNMQSSCFTIN